MRCLSIPLAFLTTVLAVASASGGQRIESNLQKTFGASPGGKLIVDADRGSLAISTGGDEVKIEVRRQVTRESADKAQEIFNAHQVTFTHEGNEVAVRARVADDRRKLFSRGVNLSVNYVISVPNSFNLDLKTSAGNINCPDISGKVIARTAGGSIQLEEVVGEVDAKTSAGNIRLKGAAKTVNVTTSGGSISLGKVQADTRAMTSAGNISVKEAGGKLSAQTSGGSIDAGELLGPAQLRTSAGSIQVEVAHGKLVASTAGGSITLNDLRNGVEAHTSAGSIRATISAQPEGDSNLSTSGGSITVKVDPELSFDVDAKATGGRVSTEIPVNATVVGEAKTGQLRGKINGGGKALVMKTSAGNITIQKK